jgi:hypothetical protein
VVRAERVPRTVAGDDPANPRTAWDALLTAVRG